MSTLYFQQYPIHQAIKEVLFLCLYWPFFPLIRACWFIFCLLGINIPILIFKFFIIILCVFYIHIYHTIKLIFI